MVFVTTVAWLSKKTDGALFTLRVCGKGQTGPTKKNTATKVMKRLATFLKLKVSRNHSSILACRSNRIWNILCTKSRPGTNLELYKSSKHQHFMKEKYETFGYKSDVDVIIQIASIIEKKAVQEEVMKVVEAIRRAPCTVQSPTTWIESLNKYVDTTSQNCSDSNFYFCLEKFLDNPEYAHFKEDISFEKSSKEQKKNYSDTNSCFDPCNGTDFKRSPNNFSHEEGHLQSDQTAYFHRIRSCGVCGKHNKVSR